MQPHQMESALTDDFSASIETPDLRNWFSSYVYQSPELTSSYCFEDSLPTEGESKDIGLYVEDSEGEEDTRNCRPSVRRSDYPSTFIKEIDADGGWLRESSDHCDRQHEVKVPKYSDSLPSEPPDIRNWFSSYVYESPVLDTAEIGGPLPSTIHSDGAEDNVTQKKRTCMPIQIKTSIDFLTNKSIQTDSFVEHTELVPFLKSETESAQQENSIEDHRTHFPTEPEKLFPGGNSCSVVEASTNGIFDGNPSKVCVYPRLTDIGTMEMLQSEEINGAGSELCNSHKSSSTKTGSPVKVNERRCTEETPETEEKGSIVAKSGPGWILPNHKSKQGNSDNINRGVSRYSGLTSAMKRSANLNENNTPRKKHVRAESIVSPEVDRGMTTRKPFMEITNVCSSGSNEIAGKWRCPQKTKPCKGPPLKQLRLEKWVHRV